MENFLEQVERVLYEKVLARDEYVLPEFQMANAWKFMMECVEKNPKVKSCVLDIETKGQGYKINQLMLDEEGMPIYANKNAYLGRIVKAKSLDNDVVSFMNGEHRQVMKMPY